MRGRMHLGLGWLAWSLAWVDGARGQWRRKRGHYDRLTLACFWRAWCAQQGIHSLLAWLSFRRDLGRPVPLRWRASLQAISEGQARFVTARQRNRARDLLAHDHESVQHALASDRRAFEAWLAVMRSAPGGLCVVGNAAGMTDVGFGGLIDASAAVVRFNRCFSPGAQAEDIGRRTDVWVFSPSCVEPAPQGVRWAVVSGPDPAGSLGRWSQVQRLREAGVPVLTVPLRIWREQVLALGAPPSAGLLLLAWLSDFEAGWDGISSVGIGWGRGRDGRHHLHATQATVGERHRWAAEQARIARWREEGLHDPAAC